MGMKAGPGEWFLPRIVRAGEPTTERRMFRPVAHSGEKFPPDLGLLNTPHEHEQSHWAPAHTPDHTKRREGQRGSISPAARLARPTVSRAVEILM
jgi:hypothetical protein